MIRQVLRQFYFKSESCYKTSFKEKNGREKYDYDTRKQEEEKSFFHVYVMLYVPFFIGLVFSVYISDCT